MCPYSIFFFFLFLYKKKYLCKILLDIKRNIHVGTHSLFKVLNPLTEMCTNKNIHCKLINKWVFTIFYCLRPHKHLIPYLKIQLNIIYVQFYSLLCNLIVKQPVTSQRSHLIKLIKKYPMYIINIICVSRNNGLKHVVLCWENPEGEPRRGFSRGFCFICNIIVSSQFGIRYVIFF